MHQSWLVDQLQARVVVASACHLGLGADRSWREPGDVPLDCATGSESTIRQVAISGGRLVSVARRVLPASHVALHRGRRTVRRDGRVSIRDVAFGIGKAHTGQELHVIIGETIATFWSTSSRELIAEHTIPAPGTKHVGYVRYARKNPTPPNPECHRCPDTELSPVS